MDPRQHEMTGRLEEETLPTLLERLELRKATGILTLTNGRIAKSIYLSEGRIVFAASNLPEDRMGDLLLRKGRLAPAQYETSVEILRRTGRKHGAVLVELGYLAPHELFLALKDQVKEILFSLLPWEEGTFSFADQPLPREVILLKLDIIEIVEEALRRIKQQADETAPPPGSPQ